MIDLRNVETMRAPDAAFSLRSGLDAGGQRWLEYTTAQFSDQTVYAIVGVSEARYRDLLNSRITLRDMFDRAESGTVYRVIRRWKEAAPGKRAYIESVSTEHIEERFQWLPAPGTYLNQ